jgi:hypothetical protein
MRKSTGIKISIAIGVALCAFVSVQVAISRRNTLDYRRFFDLSKLNEENWYQIAKKPKQPMRGNIFFLRPRSPQTDWQLICFDCEEWRLGVVHDLPGEFDDSGPSLSWVDPNGDEFWIFASGMTGAANRSFYAYRRSEGEGQWYRDITPHRLLRVERFAEYAYFEVGIEAGEGIPERRGEIDRLSLRTGQVERNCVEAELSDLGITNCGFLEVAESEFGGLSLYFSVRYEDSGTTGTASFRLDDPEATPIQVDAYPPGRLMGRDNRCPFLVPREEGRLEALLGSWFRRLAPKSDEFEFGLPDFYFLWVGTLSKWPLKEPAWLPQVASITDYIDPKAFANCRLLVGLPNTTELSSSPQFVSPDGRYVLCCQRSSTQGKTSEGDSSGERTGLIAVSMENGIQVPMLALYEGYFLFPHWTP